MKTADKDQQWKKKYYDSLDELEFKEKEWQELETLLRSVTIRMSLAIEGLDGSMDRNLDTLRSTLRKKPNKPELIKVIKGITNALDDLDKLKEEIAHSASDDKVQDGLQVMLRLLNDIIFPDNFSQRSKSLHAELLRCTEKSDLSVHVDSFRQILVDITREHVQLESMSPSIKGSVETPEKKKGLIGRLFNRAKPVDVADENNQPENKNTPEASIVSTNESQKQTRHFDLDGPLNATPTPAQSSASTKAKKAASPSVEIEHGDNVNFNRESNPETNRSGNKSNERSLTSCQSGVDVINLLANRLSLSGHPRQQVQSIAKRAQQIDNGQMLLELATDLANSLNRLWPESDEASATPEISVNEILLQLLDRLSLPPDFQQKVVLLQTQLEDVVREEEWPELLDKIAGLIGEVRKRVQTEKKDLEIFLTHLTKRIQAIDNSLQGVKQDQKQTYSNTVQLNSLVTEQMLEIRNSVQSASDLDQLKLVVDARLDAISDHMERFRVKEQQRDQKARDRVGELTARLATMEKETVELRNKVVKQRNLAMLDRLTGLANRSAYDERLDQEYRRWRRFKENLCLVMIDVDHFKNINDSYGHKAGDKVLATIAAVIKDRVRETDFVARYGGEEFVVLVTGATLVDATKIAEKFRAAIESCGFHFRGARVPITISAGVAEFCENDTPDDVFERADKAMYEAKDSGRNCCKAAKPCE